MKTKFINIILGCSFIVTLASCSLHEPLISNADKATVFGSENGIKAYSNSLYILLPTINDAFYAENGCVDYCAANSWSSFYLDGAYNPETTTSWSWTSLRRINYFIDALMSEDCTVSEDIKKHYIALGKWFRAYFYFNKLRSYGDVPWFEHVISSTDEKTMYKDRDNREIIVRNILSDLNYAYENLQTTSSVGNTLISKWAALQLKARVCLFEASWIKYHKLPETIYTSEELYRMAASTAKIIISSGVFSIHTNTGSKGAYRSLFYSTEVQTDEVILGLATDPDFGVYNSANYYFNSGSYGNGNCMSRDFAFTYLNTDGTPFTSKANYKNIMFKNEFTGRDLRLKQTVKDPNYSMSSGTKADKVPDIINSVAITGYHIIKFSLDDAKKNNNHKNTNSYPLFRYAEVLLIYAEAKAELHELTAADWKQTIGELRSRAGIIAGLDALPTEIDPYMQQNFYPTVTDPVIMEIRRERATELFFEGFRSSDLDRWAEGHLYADLKWTGIHIPDLDTAIDINGDGQEDYYFSYLSPSEVPSAHRNYHVQIYSEYSTEQGLRAIPNDVGGYDLEYRLSQTRIWYPDDRQYLTPVPPQIIREYRDRGYTLSQNPGWE